MNSFRIIFSPSLTFFRKVCHNLLKIKRRKEAYLNKAYLVKIPPLFPLQLGSLGMGPSRVSMGWIIFTDIYSHEVTILNMFQFSGKMKFGKNEGIFLVSHYYWPNSKIKILLFPRIWSYQFSCLVNWRRTLRMCDKFPCDSSTL